MFNLCHFLNVERDRDFKRALAAAQPYLWQVSVSGAKVGGKPWSQLIMPLDQGDFDQAELMRELKRLGFDGAVGLQCFGVRGDAEENLRRSIQAWRKTLHRI